MALHDGIDVAVAAAKFVQLYVMCAALLCMGIERVEIAVAAASASTVRRTAQNGDSADGNRGRQRIVETTIGIA